MMVIGFVRSFAQSYILFRGVLCQAHRGVEEIVVSGNYEASCACPQGTFAED